MRNSVIIASNALFLADKLKELLRNVGLMASFAVTFNELDVKIKAFPRFVFIEHCFIGDETGVLIHDMEKHYRSVRIVVWSTIELKPVTVARFIAAGAESYFTLRDSESAVEMIIHRIAEGRRYYPADVKTVLNSDFTLPATGEKLTDRENEVYKLTAKGKTKKEIAQKLSMSVNTVKFHRKNIYRKRGGSTAIDLLMDVLDKKNVPLDELE